MTQETQKVRTGTLVSGRFVSKVENILTEGLSRPRNEALRTVALVCPLVRMPEVLNCEPTIPKDLRTHCSKEWNTRSLNRVFPLGPEV